VIGTPRGERPGFRLPRGRAGIAASRGLAAVAPLLAGLALALLGVAAVAAVPEWFRDAEELINATVARELMAGNGRRYFLEFQYTPFCGGCTAVALMGWVSFAVWGVHFLAWKAVPAAFTCAILVLGFHVLSRGVSRQAAWCFAVLWLGIPTVLVHASMMAWGNHFEVTALILLQLWFVTAVLLPRGARPHLLAWVGWGFAAGLGFWFCFSSAFAFPALVTAVALSHRRKELVTRSPLVLIGVACGLAPLALYAWKTGNSPFLHRYLESSGYGGRQWLDLAKLADVSLAPYATTLFYVPDGAVLRWSGWLSLLSWWSAAVAGFVLGMRARASWRVPLVLPALLLAAAMGAYMVAPFRTYELPADGLPGAYQLRYLAPTMVLLLLAAAVGMGQLWRLGGRARVVAVALALAAVLPGAAARVLWLTHGGEGPRAAHLPAYDYPTYIHEVGASRIAEQYWLAIEPRTRLSLVNHRRAVGAMRVADFLQSGIEPEAFLDGLRGIPAFGAEDVPFVLHGFGQELVTVLGEVEVPPDEVAPRLAALLEAATSDERRALSAALWAGNPALLEQLGRPLPRHRSELPAAFDGPFSAAGCALCPALGEAVGLTPPPAALTAPTDLLPAGLLPDEPRWREAILTGAGARYGSEYGYLGPEIEAQLTTFPAADRAAFLTGFDVGRAQMWHVEVMADTPVECIP